MAVLSVVDGDLVVSVRMSFRRQCGKTKAYLVDQLGELEDDAFSDNHILQAVARARGWMKMLDDGKADNLLDLAARLGLDRAFVSKYIRLATISPRIVQGVIDGSAPNGLSVKKLCAIQSDDWDEQEREAEALARSAKI